MRCRGRRWLVASVLGWALGAPVWAQLAPPPPVETMAADLREQVQSLSVTVKDAYGREGTRSIAVTMFRPPGPGPFPLVIVSHGRAAGEKRAQPLRQRFEPLARYLVSKGFAVFVPTRIGYGATFGDFDPENPLACNAPRLEPVSIAASDQVLAVLNLAREQGDIDARRWVALGQSVGGLATVAVTWRHPPGLVAAINFAGGAGGNPDLRPGDPCSPRQIERLWASHAAEATVPMLWIYWQNDRYWGADNPPRWARAWADGGGKVEFHQLPPWPSDEPVDGHGGMGANMDGWVPLVEAYLGRVGFTASGLVPRLPASGYAAVDDLAKVPVAAEVREGLYQKFLQIKRRPRAFAIGPHGAAGWAAGDWAAGRALGFCQARRGVKCQLYAVDDEVVWVP